MFTLIGRYYGSRLNWFRPMRRLAKANPVDFGKTFVFCYVMAGVGYAMKWAMLRYVAKASGVNLAEEISFVNSQENTFEKRFGTPNPGDDIIFADDHENIEGPLVKMLPSGELIVRVFTGTEDGKTEDVIVNKSQVLDVIPTF